MITQILGPVMDLLDKFIPDADEKARLAHEVANLAEQRAHELAVAQVELNKVEAQSVSIFKSGWRPFIGWVCGIAFAYHFVLQPVIVFSTVAMGYPLPTLPGFDMGSLMTVLMGMLGLGGLRTYEKKSGLTK